MQLTRRLHAGYMQVTMQAQVRTDPAVCNAVQSYLGVAVTEPLEQADTQPTFFCCPGGD